MKPGAADALVSGPERGMRPEDLESNSQSMAPQYCPRWNNAAGQTTPPGHAIDSGSLKSEKKQYTDWKTRPRPGNGVRGGAPSVHPLPEKWRFLQLCRLEVHP